ncbi:RNA-directed DNA polymerase, eukaryota, reverse transcriptase zinc-binding domain protein [Tanacetum coccineum]
MTTQCSNGEGHGFFKGGRGLRQGDPISPYLCKELKLSHMCFADDLLVLCKGNKGSLEVIKKTLEEFSHVSGLNPNLGKSTIFLAALRKHVWYNIGNGEKTSMFYDKWCSNGPLSKFISKRNQYDARINDNVLVADLLVDNNWKWPNDWLSKFPVLNSINPLNIQKDKEDMVWKEVMMKSSKLGGRVVLKDIVEVIFDERSKNSIGVVVNKLIVAATVYNVWQEKNQRVFRKEYRTIKAICKISMNK